MRKNGKMDKVWIKQKRDFEKTGKIYKRILTNTISSNTFNHV